MSEAEAATKPARRGRKMILLVIVPLVLALCGAGAAMMLGVIPTPFAGEAEAAASEAAEVEPAVDPSKVVFVDLPELLVNLNVTGARLRFLKFAAALEVKDQDDADVVQQFVPRIADNFHAYMRAVQVEELGGPDAIYRVKRDLLTRVNQVLRTVEVRDVLIREMLVQ